MNPGHPESLGPVELRQTPPGQAPIARRGQLVQSGDRFQVICPETGNILVKGASLEFLLGEMLARRLRRASEPTATPDEHPAARCARQGSASNDIPK